MRWFAGAVVLASLVLPRGSNAMCAPASSYVVPRQGELLPVNPVLFLFQPPDDDTEAFQKRLVALKVTTTAGKPLPFTRTELPRAGALRVYRLAIQAPHGTEFQLDPPIPIPGRWRVSKDWKRPASLSVCLAEAKQSSWTCSYDSTWVLSTSVDAPAYRITSAPSRALLESGATTEAVVEGKNAGHLWSRARANIAEPRSPPRVELGHHDCVGSNFDWSAPRLAIRVTALLPDGSSLTADDVFELDAPPTWTQISQGMRDSLEHTAVGTRCPNSPRADRPLPPGLTDE